jgi:oxygen-independent coproporphyrinogen-3 oxidase
VAGFDLRRLAAGCALSLYVHVPFCRSKCPYCDFFSLPGCSRSLMERVLAETTSQLECFREWLAPSRIHTIYVGGGTPSILPGALLRRLFSAIRSFTAGLTEENPEWSVEANPESLNEEFLQTCTEFGITRLSLGLQSMQENLLRRLGRPGDEAANRKALRLLESRWRGRLNLDLLAGIPGQDLGLLREDLNQAIDQRPGHISFYALTPVAGSSLEPQIDPELQEQLWLAGYEQLEEAGYRNYEISNFARPGEECRHNLRYWRLQPYLGVGPGAVSTLPGRAGEVYRLSNPEDLDPFLAGRTGLWGIQGEGISPRDFLFETLMMGLRLREGVSRECFRLRFGKSIEAMIPELWSQWQDRGLVSDLGAHYALNDKGRLILDRLLIELGQVFEKIKLPNLDSVFR